MAAPEPVAAGIQAVRRGVAVEQLVAAVSADLICGDGTSLNRRRALQPRLNVPARELRVLVACSLDQDASSTLPASHHHGSEIVTVVNVPSTPQSPVRGVYWNTTPNGLKVGKTSCSLTRS